MCICTFVIQHAMGTHHIVISDLSGCTIFSILSHKGAIFERKKTIIEHTQVKMCVLTFSSILAGTIVIYSKNN